jgi:hypothetical protein
MSRRWTGWVLTAAAIAAGPAPALSSNDPLQTPGQGFATTVAQADAAPPAGGYSDCLELTPPREAVKGGEVLVLKMPYPTSKANGDLRLNGMSGGADAQLRAAIERSKGDGAGEDMEWLLLPDDKLVPQGVVQPTKVRSACGIPKGLTQLLPSDE